MQKKFLLDLVAEINTLRIFLIHLRIQFSNILDNPASHQILQLLKLQQIKERQKYLFTSLII